MTEQIVARPRGAHRARRGPHPRALQLRQQWAAVRASDVATTWLVHVALWAALIALLVLGLQLDAAFQAAAAGGLVAAAAGRPGRAAALLHAEPHPLAGESVKLDLSHEGLDPPVGQFRVEDWWDRVSGGVRWADAAGNAAALKYAMRSAFGGLAVDDEVVYGKDEHGLGHIVHVSELVEPSQQDDCEGPA